MTERFSYLFGNQLGNGVGRSWVQCCIPIVWAPQLMFAMNKPFVNQNAFSDGARFERYCLESSNSTVSIDRPYLQLCSLRILGIVKICLFPILCEAKKNITAVSLLVGADVGWQQYFFRLKDFWYRYIVFLPYLRRSRQKQWRLHCLVKFSVRTGDVRINTTPV